MFHSRDREKKQEKIIAEARDPASAVTSEDAEKYMVEQTRVAGGAAYQFNPAASPEEKAAQARSVRVHSRLSHGVARKPSDIINSIYPRVSTMKRSRKRWE